jgi:hypothetical protein
MASDAGSCALRRPAASISRTIVAGGGTDGSASNAAKKGSVQREDGMNVDGQVSGYGNDEGSKAIIIQTIPVLMESALVDLANAAGWQRSMDDLILRAAMWHDAHLVDRGELLRAPQRRT